MQGQDSPAALPAQPEFPGFDPPRFTQVPDQVIDELMADLSGAELKVLLYVVRRTFGFGKDADAISVSQMAGGISKRDGEVLDRGTGLARSSIRKATAALVERGILTVRQVQDESGEYESNVYALRMRGVGQKSDHPPAGVGRKSDHRGPIIDQGVGRKSDPQETVIQETVIQETEFEDSKIRRARVDFLERYDEARLALLPFVEDLAREMNDQAPLASTATRVVNLYRASGLGLDEFLDRLLQARAITQERTGAIRGRAEGFGPKPKMAYLLSVLADITSREAS